MEINDVTYGNPNIEYKKILTESCLVGDLFSKLKSEGFPLNNSELTKDELNEIVDYLASIKEPSNEAFLKRYKAYDRSLSQVLISTFKQRNLDLEELAQSNVNKFLFILLPLRLEGSTASPATPIAII